MARAWPGAVDGPARALEAGTVPRREPRRENPLGQGRGAASIPPCTWPSPPRGAPSSAGLWSMARLGLGLGLGAGAGGAI
eukprot:scaffold24244_cov63-Phaeocystis_antarctica.AAC.1